MKYLNIFLLFVIALILTSCQKVEDPYLKEHKFTYSLTTDGDNVYIRHKDYKGSYLDTKLSKGTWHVTYKVNPNDKMYLAFIVTDTCNVSLRFAQDGKYVLNYPKTIQSPNYEKSAEYIIRENP